MRRIWIDQPIKSAAAWFEDAVVFFWQSLEVLAHELLLKSDSLRSLILLEKMQKPCRIILASCP
jgi:hypothetical protein